MNAVVALMLTFQISLGPSVGPTALGREPGQTYIVTDRSQVEEGCFDLCACPIAMHGGPEGGLLVRPQGTDGSFLVFAVEHVRWVYTSVFGSAPTYVTGAGEWRVDRTARLQRLDLDLTVGGAAPARYSSGLVPLTVDLPLLSVAIEPVGEFCFETHFDLAAAPRPGDSTPAAPGTTFQTLSTPSPEPPCSWGMLKSSYDSPH